MHLKRLLQTLRQPLRQQLNKGAIIFFFTIAGLGFADATYLTVEHFMNSVPPCAVGGCEIVLTSSFATVAGIPVALTGALYYLALLIFLKLYVDTKKEKFLRIALGLTFVGMIATIYFFILQAFVIKAYCLYCLGSTATSTALFVGALVVLHKNSKITQP